MEFLVAVFLLLLVVISILALAMWLGLRAGAPWADGILDRLRTDGEPPNTHAHLGPPDDPLPDSPPPRALTDADAFTLNIQTGAVMPTAQRMELHLDELGPIVFERRPSLGAQADLEHSYFASSDLLGYVSDLIDLLLTRGDVSADGGLIDGDYLVVEATKGGQTVSVSLFNAYDKEACAFVKRINAMLPSTMQMSFSHLDGPHIDPALP